MREKIALNIAARLKDGDIIGVGTGSTVDVAIDAISKRVREEKLNIRVVPTSYETTWRCESIGLSVLSPLYCNELSWGFDGADEVDSQLRLIKGKGAALLKEKILAHKCKHFVVIVDEGKLVKKLGERCAVPVEVVPEARFIVERSLRELGASELTLRQAQGKHGAVITEAGNLIIDVRFSTIADTLESRIKSIVGVVENGIFTNDADEVIVGKANGSLDIFKP